MQKNSIMTVMSSHRGFILAVSGAAVGIGSIWRMPYMIGENGGSLFILCYLFFTVVLGLPAMMSEIVVGRVGRKPPFKSIQHLTENHDGSQHWTKIAILGTIASVLILSFYCVVSGWGLRYFVISLKGVPINDITQAESLFNNFLGNPVAVLTYGTIFLLMTFTISAFRVNKGIERLNDTLMPLLYLILVILVVYAASLPGFKTALSYLLKPDWSRITPSMLTAAMGMSFFTLATGACCLMAYGAYMPKSQSVLTSAFIVAIINLLVTLCAGIAIFSIVFSYGMNASSGPGLIFMALPVALNDMALGTWILPILFFLLIVACWTSAVNLAEPLVTALSYRYNSRIKGTMLSALIVWCLGCIPALSFSLLKNIKIWDRDLFTIYTGIATDICLPFTAFLILLLTSFVMQKKTFMQHIGASNRWGAFWFTLIKYISPWGLLFIFVGNFIQ